MRAGVQLVALAVASVATIGLAQSVVTVQSATVASPPGGPGLILAAGDLRPGLTLSGPWRWSVDPYRDGEQGFHGAEAGTGHRRADDVDVEAASIADPRALYEYDMDRSPVAVLPQSWLTHSPDMRRYQGLVWYQRRFDAVPTPGRRQLLRFGAVNYKADIFLNGRRVGRHEGGFTPFTFEVTGLLRAGTNRLTVGADSEPSAATVPPPVTDWENYGGITRAVTLVEVPETFVDDAWVRLSRDGRLHVDVALNGRTAGERSVQLTIPELRLALNGRTDARGHWRASIAAPPGLRRWSPEQPVLYDVNIQAGEDRWRDRIGFRTVETRGSQILLNGRPIFLRGVSVHEEEIGAEPTRAITPASARALLGEAKDGLRANFVRLAHYPHSEVMTRAADELGLIVWSEIPVYWRIAWDNPGTLARARAMLAENIGRDRNRASILLWSVGNETPVGAPRNAFLRTLIADVRHLDPERLVTAALLTERRDEGGTPVMVMADPLAADLDVMAVNTYNGWYSPDRLADLPRIGWQTPGAKPLILSEFGADALVGFHDKAPRKFSEEYQAEYYRQTLAMAARIPNLAGLSPWILKDFRSPRRQHPVFQQGWNRKGLISETGQRKQAFAVLRDWYARREGK